MSRSGVPSRPSPSALLPGAAVFCVSVLVVLPVSQALAYWQLTPQVEAGITYQTNPRYLTSEQEAVNPDGGDDVLGTYIDVLTEGSWKTPSTTVSLQPRLRRTDYLKANDDLNNDDTYLSFLAAHTGSRGSVGLNVFFQDTLIITSDFQTAAPDEPGAPPPVNGTTGRYSNATQKTWSYQPSLTFQVSTLNALSLTGQLSDTTYNEDNLRTAVTPLYVDYSNSSVELAIRHYLNPKSSFVLALNGGNFTANNPGSRIQNSTDSFGLTAAYDYTFSATLTGSVTVGTTRSGADISGITFGQDPLTGAPCSVADSCSSSNEARNFVGYAQLRKRSEDTTFTVSLSRAIAPNSNGTQTVQDSVRLDVNQTLTRKLTGGIGTVYSKDSSLSKNSSQFGNFRQDSTYLTVDSRISWNLTETLSVYSSYSYISSQTDQTSLSSNFKQSNNRVFFGVLYRGVGFRR